MFDSVVVGASPSGLASSAALSARGVDRVLRDRGRFGQSWRTQRRDTLRLNSPGWMNPMLGVRARDAYLTAAEVVERLDTLATTSPVHEGARVNLLARDGDGWVLRTGEREIRARTVVLATGGENVQRIPALARMIPGRVAQYHAEDYRIPGLPREGAALIVTDLGAVAGRTSRPCRCLTHTQWADDWSAGDHGGLPHPQRWRGGRSREETGP